MAAMDATRRKALEDELAQAVAERAELDLFITALQRRLGIEGAPPPPQGGGLPLVPHTPPPSDPSADPETLVGEAEFYGKNSVEAAKAVLERVGRTRPLKTEALYSAIKKGGVTISSPQALYRSLTRNTEFHRVARGRWGLSIWYPSKAATKDTQVESLPEPPPPVTDNGSVSEQQPTENEAS